VKQICRIFIFVFLIPVLAITARAEETDTYAKNMLRYYQYYQQEAMPEIRYYLDLMEAEETDQAAKWKSVMELWNWADTQMPVFEGVLPDGLPEDDSLCIVVLGYGLTKNGAMKPELLDRLEVAQASAEKYPNAWVLLTGGETAYIPGISEAGEMRAWLVNQGIDARRILMDTEAMSTTENARNSCRILAGYPQVNTIAVVTSDYHCRWGASLLSVAAYLEKGASLQVACGAGCETDNDSYDSYSSQAWGIALLTGLELDHGGKPELFLPRETVPAETEAAIQMTEEVSEQNTGFVLWPVALLLVAELIWRYLRRKKK